jgi:hypothetical protein
MGATATHTNLRGDWVRIKEVTVPYFKAYSRICIEGLKKTTRNLRMYSQSFDSKPVPSKYKAAMLTLRFCHSVQ